MNARTFAATLHWLLPLFVANSALAQSFPLTDTEQIREGEILFGFYCASCHGADARGGGPVAKEMKTPPPSLRQIAARRDGVFAELEIMSYIDGRNMPRAHGNSEMPVWGSLFGYVDEARTILDSDQQLIEQKVQQKIASIVKYLGSIQDP